MGYETLLEQIKAVCAWNSLTDVAYKQNKSTIATVNFFSIKTTIFRLNNLRQSNKHTYKSEYKHW